MHGDRILKYHNSSIQTLDPRKENQRQEKLLQFRYPILLRKLKKPRKHGQKQPPCAGMFDLQHQWEHSQLPQGRGKLILSSTQFKKAGRGQAYKNKAEETPVAIKVSSYVTINLKESRLQDTQIVQEDKRSEKLIALLLTYSWQRRHWRVVEGGGSFQWLMLGNLNSHRLWHYTPNINLR